MWYVREAGDSSNCIIEEWVNNCRWGWQNWTVLGKCTHLYDETRKHKRFRQKIVFIRCEKIDNNKRRRKQRRRQTRRSWCIKNHQLLLVCLLCFLLLLLSSIFLHLMKTIFCRKRLCFLVFRRTGEYISPDLFYSALFRFCQDVSV